MIAMKELAVTKMRAIFVQMRSPKLTFAIVRYDFYYPNVQSPLNALCRRMYY